MTKIGFDMSKVSRFTRAFGGQNLRVLQPTFRLWGTRYLSETRKRFKKNSDGGGEWQRLKPATIAGRRKGKRRGRSSRGLASRSGGGNVKILQNYGILFKALSVGQPGNLYRLLRRGIRVGFGGPAKHPDGKATIADIAKFHNVGKGNNPKRRILHPPSRELRAFMRMTLARAIDKTGKRL
ncbi:hypothetical protein DRH27_02965 [Candidatus Falkowbacteria bacterium]|nr:MAG: hypothetical protein DRH27_02965 [Candidatus Falkowbacteria bacterium]